MLGHVRAQTTKDVYAPEPNLVEILRWEDEIQRPGRSEGEAG